MGRGTSTGSTPSPDRRHPDSDEVNERARLARKYREVLDPKNTPGPIRNLGDVEERLDRLRAADFRVDVEIVERERLSLYRDLLTAISDGTIEGDPKDLISRAMIADTIASGSSPETKNVD